MSSTESKEIKKDDDVLSLLSKVSVQNSESIKELSKKFDALITKLGDSNPVAHGPVLEAKPKTTDEQEIGDKVKATNAYGHSRQASIINSENPQSDSDNPELSMEEHKKSTPTKTIKMESEEKKEEEKKEEITKTDMKKTQTGFSYVKVDAIRPAIFAKTFDETPATGYQLIKAIQTGWGGKYTDADGAMSEAYMRLSKGEFGMGVPGEY